MKLREYVNKSGMGFSALAREMDIARSTLEKLYYKTSKDIYLSIAMKIVEYSKGEVTIADLYSDYNTAMKKGRKPKHQVPEPPQEKT